MITLALMNYIQYDAGHNKVPLVREKGAERGVGVGGKGETDRGEIMNMTDDPKKRCG
jgi:hypothetical protein